MNDRIEQYIEQHTATWTPAEEALLAELDRVTHLRVVQPQMVSGRTQGAFLTLITRMLRPRRVLEIGTFTGYSALALAAGLPHDGELHTIEVDDELEDLAREFFAKSPHCSKIHLHIGSALDLAPRLAREKGPFDLIYMDGDKREYPAYYRMLLDPDPCAPAQAPLVNPGSIILADNVLWYEKVADLAALDPHTLAIREFNAFVASDPRVENVILPLRDGINLIRVK